MDTGIYTQCLSNGLIHNVQVVDSAGNTRPMEPSTYKSRGLQPPLENLPDVAHYKGQL
jgi:hypothetical protein